MRWVLPANHRDIGIRYLIFGCAIGLVVMVVAGLVEIGWYLPGAGQLTAQVLMSGQTIPASFALLPLLFAAPGHLTLARDLGEKGIATGFLAAIAFTAIIAGAGILAAAVIMPAEEAAASPGSVVLGRSTMLMLAGLALAALSHSLTALSFILTFARHAGRTVGLAKISTATWFFLASAIVFAGFFGYLSYLLFQSPSVRQGTSSLDAGWLDPILLDLVYGSGAPHWTMLLLPVAASASAAIVAAAGRPVPFAPFTGLIAAVMAGGSLFIWLHPVLAMPEPLPTQILALTEQIPFRLLVFILIITLGLGSWRQITPLLWLAGFVVLLEASAWSGDLLAAVSSQQLAYNNAAFMNSRIQQVFDAAAMFVFFGACYALLPDLTGRAYRESVGIVHFVCTFAGMATLIAARFIPELIAATHTARSGEAVSADFSTAASIGVLIAIGGLVFFFAALAFPKAPDDGVTVP